MSAGTVVIPRELDPVAPMNGVVSVAAETREATLQRAAAVLRGGGLVVFPTDTLYGIAANPCDPIAVERVFVAKGRPPGQPLPLVAADMAQVERVTGRLPPRARRLAAAFWPGPLSLVLDAWSALVPAVHAGTGTMAIRVPARSLARALAAYAGFPLVATSANRSGQPAPVTARQAADALAGHVDLVLDDGPTGGGPASTIVDVRGDRLVVVREGAVGLDRVRAVLETASDRAGLA